MNDLTNKKTINYTLPEIKCAHPESGKPLCIVTPVAGKMFDVKLSEDITKDELLIVVSDLAEFCYHHSMKAQKSLIDMGFPPEQVGDLFFPESEKIPIGAPSEVLLEKLADVTRAALAGSKKWQNILDGIPLAKLSEVGTIDFSEWDQVDYMYTLEWLKGEHEKMPERISKYLQNFGDDDGTKMVPN